MKTLTKPKTHIAQIRLSDAGQIEEVCDLLGWSEEQYCWYMFDRYNEFIDRLFQDYPEIAKQVRYSSVFRGFWNNEVSYRNAVEFLPFARLEYPDSPVVTPEFLYIHDPLTLMHDDRFMMKYNAVLGLIRKEQVC